MDPTPLLSRVDWVRGEPSWRCIIPFPSKPGIYALLITLKTDVRLTVGRSVSWNLKPGIFVYVGSARGPGGLLARLSRHLRSPAQKRTHWHIDRLLVEGRITEIWWLEGSEPLECAWAQTWATVAERTPTGFGASDCRCGGHLFRLSAMPEADFILGQSQHFVVNTERP